MISSTTKECWTRTLTGWWNHCCKIKYSVRARHLLTSTAVVQTNFYIVLYITPHGSNTQCTTTYFNFHERKGYEVLWIFQQKFKILFSFRIFKLYGAVWDNLSGNQHICKRGVVPTRTHLNPPRGKVFLVFAPAIRLNVQTKYIIKPIFFQSLFLLT